MSEWVLEPGHTGAEFRAKHMMVTWVRGHFKDIHGELEFDENRLSLNMNIDTNKLWTGEEARDKHLKSPDFFDVENYPAITFQSKQSERIGAVDYKVTGDLQIRGITKQITLPLQYLGKWKTPYWVDAETMFSVTRIGFTGHVVLNRQDFKVSWNSRMESGGLVVADDILITLDMEALLKSELFKS